MRFVSAFFRIVIGLVFGFISGLAVSPAIAAFSDGQGGNAWVIFALAGLGALLCFFAPTIRRAFGRGFLVTGVAVFVLPLSMMMLSGRVANDMMNEQGASGATMIGAGLAGTMATGIAGFIGFFLGAVLLTIGLVLALGGRREVYVVERPVPSGTRQEPRI